MSTTLGDQSHVRVHVAGGEAGTRHVLRVGQSWQQHGVGTDRATNDRSAS
ncbi:MAG: hypothetical protein QOK42_964 [Frankiaceae bacterium]|jgi:hypothetical protein|nr:hypothetical protein [Frankiaceae bacterium]